MKETKKHSMLSNFFYAWKLANKAGKGLLVGTLIIGIFQFTNHYIWLYVPKLIVSFVEKNYTIKHFVSLTIVVCVCLFLANALNRYGYTKIDFEFIKNNAFLEKLRMKKMFKTDYKNMENPDFLDFSQKAKTALYMGNGFHGVLYETHNIISNSLVIIVSAILIGVKNVFILQQCYLWLFL